jgi:large conductance mechanosensitive channel
MSLWAQFKEFLSNGNILGLAVAVVLGVAFGAVVSSFTKDILMQLIAAIGAQPNFGSLAVNLHGATPS